MWGWGVLWGCRYLQLLPSPHFSFYSSLPTPLYFCRNAKCFPLRGDFPPFFEKVEEKRVWRASTFSPLSPLPPLSPGLFPNLFCMVEGLLDLSNLLYFPTLLCTISLPCVLERGSEQYFLLFPLFPFVYLFLHS